MTRSQRLLAVLVLNLALCAGLVAAGAAAGSLATAATGGDYLLDAAAVGVALLAARLAARPRKRPGRAGRMDPVSAAALINAGWLLALELLVAVAAVTRLASGAPRVEGLPVLLASGLAAVVMTAGALILRGDDPDPGGDGDRDVSVHAVLLDTVADAAAAAGTAVAGGIILATGGLYWLDPAVALVIALVVAGHAVALIRKVLARLRAARGRAGGSAEPPPSRCP
jgi:cobalt-zinc-cadmium efflux system protein